VARKFWRVLGINLLISLIVGIIASIVAFIAGISSLISPYANITNYVTSFISSAFITPIFHISVTLLFMDTKARVEPLTYGYDARV